MIADTDEKNNECIEKSLNYLSAIGRSIVYRVCFGEGFVEVALLAMTEKQNNY